MRTLTALALTLALAAPAPAGIVDSPIPALFTKIVYSVSGVINDGKLGAFVSCTNVHKQNVTFGIEVFGPTGGDPLHVTSGAVSLAPGATGIVGTASAVGISVNINYNIGPVSKGSARILSTSTKLVCTAFLADILNSPPTSMVPLNVVAKTKQKAAN